MGRFVKAVRYWWIPLVVSGVFLVASYVYYDAVGPVTQNLLNWLVGAPFVAGVLGIIIFVGSKGRRRSL